MKKVLVLVSIFFSSLGLIYAQEVSNANTEQPSAPQETTKARSTDSYYADPFSDMAELDNQDEDEQEEALDRFYSYGRIFHVEAYGNMAYFRGPMSYIYHRGWMMGGRISYFLDWDLAIICHVSLGKASMEFANPITADNYPLFTGSATLFNIGFGLKYYFNFHDISRAIAYINPAIQAGAEMSIVNDSLDMTDIPSTIIINDPSHKMAAPGLFFGFSIEIPIFRKSVLLGGEFLYHLSYFPAKNSKIPAGDPHFGSLDYSGNYMTLGGSFIINL